jgi:hypothetical protein
MFTDKFFKFPIKVYDGFSVKDSERKEEDMGVPVEALWYKGWAKIPVRELEKGRFYWFDAFSKGANVEKDGMDMTIVCFDKFGNFSCVWPRELFEKKLDEFMAKWEIKTKNEVI